MPNWHAHCDDMLLMNAGISCADMVRLIIWGGARLLQRLGLLHSESSLGNDPTKCSRVLYSLCDEFGLCWVAPAITGVFNLSDTRVQADVRKALQSIDIALLQCPCGAAALVHSKECVVMHVTEFTLAAEALRLLAGDLHADPCQAGGATGILAHRAPATCICSTLFSPKPHWMHPVLDAHTVDAPCWINPGVAADISIQIVEISQQLEQIARGEGVVRRYLI